VTPVIQGASFVEGTEMMRRILVVFIASVIVVSAAAGAHLAPPNIVKPGMRVGGKYYGDWAAEWWKWALKTPPATNPVKDTTGANAAVGQDPASPVFFLGGTFGGDAERTVTIPAGKSVFFPVVNTIWWHEYWDTDTEETLRAGANAWVDSVDILKVKLDGKSVKNLGMYRAESPVFAFDIPEDSVPDEWANPAYWPNGYPAMTFDLAVADGYWLLLEPMEAGPHTIEFIGGIKGPDGFATRVVYHITQL
jgi:hypothetical protein